MNSSQQFQSAARAALEPWSSSDQKIGALAYMESLATPEALKVMRQAMELTGLYVSPQSRNNPNLPLSGEVAGAAARGIGRLDALGGLDLLLKILLSEDESKILRECAAFGLGGLVTKQAFDAFEKAIQVTDPIVFERVLSSIEESYMFLGKKSLPHTDDFFVFLFNCAADCILKQKEQINSPRVYAIIAKYINKSAEADIIKFLSGTINQAEWRVAINVLLHRDTREARNALISVLMLTGIQPEVYKSIGERLRASREASVRKGAEAAIGHYPMWRKIFQVFLSGERERRDAQLVAANLVLSNIV